MEISLNDSSILGQVALTREARIVNRAYEYANFNRRVDAETKFTTQSILCLPILEPETRANSGVSVMHNKQKRRLFGVTQLLKTGLKNHKLQQNTREKHLKLMNQRTLVISCFLNVYLL